MAKDSPRQNAQIAAKAHTDLTLFYAIIDIVEGSNFSGDADEDAQKVMKLCKGSARKCLRRYDAALARL